MELMEWLETRTPEAPVVLRVRIADLVLDHPEWESMPLPEALMAAGERLMQDVLAAPPRNRDSALDLLAADACVTYAFEAAADDPVRIAGLAEQAMARIALLAE